MPRPDWRAGAPDVSHQVPSQSSPSCAAVQYNAWLYSEPDSLQLAAPLLRVGPTEGRHRLAGLHSAPPGGAPGASLQDARFTRAPSLRWDRFASLLCSSPSARPSQARRGQLGLCAGRPRVSGGCCKPLLAAAQQIQHCKCRSRAQGAPSRPTSAAEPPAGHEAR